MALRCKSSNQQLPHWLWRMVDSEACFGVRWLDRAERSFKIPWINQTSSEWSEEYSQIFAEYAKHTGKLQTVGKIDHPKCKQNFKSAVGKSKALKCLSKDKAKKYRVYRFEEDYSSSKDREHGNYQQTRSQSSDEGGDVWMEGTGVGTQELADTGTPQVTTEQLLVVQLTSGGESSQIQNTTVDSTTGIRSGSVESTGDGQILTATAQPQADYSSSTDREDEMN